MFRCQILQNMNMVQNWRFDMEAWAFSDKTENEYMLCMETFDIRKCNNLASSAVRMVIFGLNLDDVMNFIF